ncbi:EpsI family protein, partial [Candidatus Pacearchaeota archaeon]|nr:EpsI family protein [Candidatus Pacearchaeota archaeon]
KINKHELKELVLDDGANLTVNRLYIQNGSYKQLVYYWFDQRGRRMTNEYLVKWYLFWDALTKNRTDGSLVRVMIEVKPDGNIQNADKTLQGFINTVNKDLTQFIPE